MFKQHQDSSYNILALRAL